MTTTPGCKSARGSELGEATGRISRRTLLASMAAAVAAGPGMLGGQSPERPNILFALADDWSWPHASIANDPVVKTPTFDRVAREGVLFRNAFVTAPSCTPSRASMLTGQWPWRLGEGANLAGTLPAQYPVYPDLLEAAGYHVGFVGKGWAPGNVTAGGRTRNPAGKAYTDVGAFFAARPPARPFCLWFGCHDPHRPYEPNQYAGPVDPARVEVPPYLPDAPEVRKDVADYYFAVERYDTDTAAILKRLEGTGELDRTMMVMAGDNGWPFPRCKANVYDFGTHVPLAVRWPGRARAGAVEHQFVSMQDLAPTFLEAGRVAVPAQMTGRSLTGLLRSGRTEAGRGSVLTGMERHMGAREMVPVGYPMRALRTPEWLYIRNFKPERWPAGDASCTPVSPEQIETVTYAGYADIDAGLSKALLVTRRDDPAIRPCFMLATAKRPAQELYFMPRDPYQLTNLAGDSGQRDRLREMDAALTAELRRTDDPRMRGEDLDRVPMRQDPEYVEMREKAFAGCVGH